MGTALIFDACLFAGETDMLELRMRTLGPYVDGFVVVACARTHQGEPADVDMIADSFAEVRGRVHAMPSRAGLAVIEPQLVLDQGGSRLFERAPDDRGPLGSPFFQHIERQHRNGVTEAVYTTFPEVAPTDLILVSDVDEIPEPLELFEMRRNMDEKHAKWIVFAQRFHSTALDLLHPQQPWLGTCVSKWTDLQPQLMRDQRAQMWDDQWVVVGGWHFSWFGSDEERARKLATFSHAELAGWDHVGARARHEHANGERLSAISIEESQGMGWPVPLVDGTFTIPSGWFSDDWGNV